MIISASRRTDMPAFFPREIISELKSKLFLDDVGLVLWTKNPEPFRAIGGIEYLFENKIPFYFQYTLNDYPQEIEPNIPPFEQRIQSFKNLSDEIGRKRVIWRFDPILLTKDISKEYIVDHINYVANELHNYTDKLVFSFVDIYPKIDDLGFISLPDNDKIYIEENILKITEKYKLKCATCAETFSMVGFEPNKCIDDELLNYLSGGNLTLKYTKDCAQRRDCKCIPSIDIGKYHTCKHNCLYCYAN
jgi:DNA repair photolyase